MRLRYLLPVLLSLGLPAAAQTNYAQIAANVLLANLRDPTSVMQAQRTPPFQTRVGFRPAVVVCVRLNATNAFGGYTGSKTHSIVFWRPDDPILMERTDVGCDRAGWRSFPEIGGY